MACTIEILLDTNEEFSAFMNQSIKEFNNDTSIHHKAARKKGAVQPLNIIASENGKWVGGITAEIYWGWLEIKEFWFAEEFRGKGLGSSLLDKTEELAKEKGAAKVLLTTFEFQARPFYESKGYKVVGEVKDYPPGSSYYTMVKTL